MSLERHRKCPMPAEKVLVIGLGETGKPLSEILAATFSVVVKDVAPLDLSDPVGVMHVCYPYQVGDFVENTSGYIQQYKPSLVTIHATVVPGTTRAVFERTGVPIAYSAVRGKHTDMKNDMLSYTKFVAGVTGEATTAAAEHLQAAGIPTGSFSSPEALEMAKLLETTYFGMLLAWTQEMERYSRSVQADYYEVMEFMKEIDYLPPVVFHPGYIGGHCVIPNSHLLDDVRHSPFTELIRQSNEQKAEEWRKQGRALEERLRPEPARPTKMGEA